MVVIHRRSMKKMSGARKVPYRKKRLFEKGSRPTLTVLGKKKIKITGIRGGGIKAKLHNADTANVMDKKTKKTFKAKIVTVLENPANRNYVRRNIITKGTIIETDKGKARVTSRPGQEGTVNAVLI